VEHVLNTWDVFNDLETVECTFVNEWRKREQSERVLTEGQPQFVAVLCLCDALVLHVWEPQSVISPV
jgi:hypothetical protein